jgi:hypothetical protein
MAGDERLATMPAAEMVQMFARGSLSPVEVHDRERTALG